MVNQKSGEPSFFTDLVLLVLVVIGAVTTAALLVLSIWEVMHKGEPPVETCTSPVICGNYWADPLTKECGVRLNGTFRGSREACPEVLALPIKAFGQIRHCWPSIEIRK